VTNDERALVLFSGGQDSTTCLAWALDRFSLVETVGFDYGQRHRVELECRAPIRRRITLEFPAWADRLGDDHLLKLPVLGEISDTALTRQSEITFATSGLPSTFVPGRNLLFIALAAAVAYRRDLAVIVGGMCEADMAGYPDCREATMKAMESAICLGMDRRFRIETPLMCLDKAGSWRLGHTIGGEGLVSLILTETHTCYLGQREVLHSWGYGCGSCPACDLRAKGHARWVECS
jgi:7-cyano-7-deazaguanine synthase